MEDYEKIWKPKHDVLCEKYGIKLIRWGYIYGAPETYLQIYETDLAPREFNEFRSEMVYFIKGWFKYTKTNIVTTRG